VSRRRPIGGEPPPLKRSRELTVSPAQHLSRQEYRNAAETPACTGEVALRRHGERPRVDGKFLAVGEERLWLRGVTYGTFAPDEDGLRFGTPASVRRDFAAMAANGINSVRTYTAPPLWLLDEALRHGLWVMVGVAWEQHVAFLDDPQLIARIKASVRAQARSCAGHPAVLCFAVGNEIPTPLVRWHGRRRVEKFIARLCTVVRAEDPGALLTYVNYPSTEYLRLPFLDFVAFNLYLDDGPHVSRYLARLQNLAGEKPLILAELGADSSGGREAHQAETVASQVETAFAAGCAGTFVFAWTDEWHRGDDAVVDWHFGLTDRERLPKAALRALRPIYQELGAVDEAAPLVSVIVCTHNGSKWLQDCLAGIAELRYPAVQTIVVDDGSTDDTAAIAAKFDVQLIQTANQGLSAARNVGLSAAEGEFVAYLDDDARPDRDWLTFLVATFGRTDHAAVGGPNLPPSDDGALAACVANAPGGPIHVLVSDTEAEHIPGCNMAYRRSVLLALGGFDGQFRAAGDDVDLCWRLRATGATLGFHPAAVVWHHRRASVGAYWRQQRGYGRAEALLERKWPERYNRRGHLTWTGRLYDRPGTRSFRPTRIYHGTWGTGAFQPEELLEKHALTELAAAPEWYLILAALSSLTLLGFIWSSLFWCLPVLVLGSGISLAEATHGALRADLGTRGKCRTRRATLRLVTAFLYLLQPAARLAGRLSEGLSPWRHRRTAGVVRPRSSLHAHWHETWSPPRERVAWIEQTARDAGARVHRGGPYDRWDLELPGGALGSTRVLVSVEEHGRGRQLVRSRAWPRVSPAAWRVGLVVGGLAAATAFSHRLLAASVFSVLLVMLAARSFWECGISNAATRAAIEQAAAGTPAPSPELLIDLAPRLRTVSATGVNAS
jgi:O-antigen biosynthesis protein